MENINFEKLKDEIEIEIKGNQDDDEICFNVSELQDSVFKRMLFYLNDISMSPLEFLLTSLLTAMSGAVGKNVYWKFSESFNLYLNLWAVIVGASTISKKSSAIQMALHDCFRIDKNFREFYQEEKKKYEALSKEEKEKTEKPQREFLILPNDVTIESLSEILSHSKRGIMFHSEFGGFLAQLQRSYSQDSKMILTDLFDTPPIKEISRATKENTFIERPYFSMLGGSTIEWIKENSSKEDLRTGFFARMLFSIRNTNEKKFISVFDLNELTYRSQYYFNTREIFDFLTSINEEHILQATDEAKKIFKEYEKQNYFSLLELVRKKNNEEEIAFKGRLVFSVLKIAGLLALAGKKFVVDETAMRNAIVIGKYFQQNVEKLLQDELVQKSPLQVKEERIYDLIKEKDKILRSELMKRKIASSVKEFDLIIEGLIQQDLIEIAYEYNKGNNRRSVFYRLKK
jgi:hypothetical protein